MNRLSVLFFLIIVVLIGGVIYLLQTEQSSLPTADDEPVFCTMDAKVCPDGSAVGRVPPACEFATCPAIKPLLPPEEPALEATTTETTTVGNTTVSST
mgnify:FL=1